MLSSAPHPARSTIGGCGTLDGGAGGIVDVALAEVAGGDEVAAAALAAVVVSAGAAVSVGVAVEVSAGAAVSVGAAVAAGAAVSAGVLVAVATSVGVAVSVGPVVAAAATYAAGSACSPLLPGSTRSSRSPSGSRDDVPLAVVTRSSTPSDGPTRSGSVPPRVARPASPDTPSDSRVSQRDHSPEPASRARAEMVPSNRAAGSVQVTPSRLYG